MNSVAMMQAEAVKEGLMAKREYEIAQQVQKVRALAGQVKARLDSLARLNDDVHLAVGHAEDMPVHYSVGVFGHDTETIDALLSTLSEESQALDHMRAAAQKTDALSEKYGTQMAEAMMQQAEQQQAEQTGEAPGDGRVFEMPAAGGGMYL